MKMINFILNFLSIHYSRQNCLMVIAVALCFFPLVLFSLACALVVSAPPTPYLAPGRCNLELPLLLLNLLR